MTAAKKKAPPKLVYVVVDKSGCPLENDAVWLLKSAAESTANHLSAQYGEPFSAHAYALIRPKPRSKKP